MGTWEAPFTREKADRLAELVREPVLAIQATDMLWDVVGDDGFMDMVDRASKTGPGKDVRGLLAMTLDEWVDFTDRSGLFGAEDEGLRKLAEVRDFCAAQEEARVAVRSVSSHRRSEDAARAAAEVFGIEPGEVEVAPWKVEGVMLARSPAGEVLRFETVFGTLLRVPDSCRAAAEAAFEKAAPSL